MSVYFSAAKKTSRLRFIIIPLIALAMTAGCSSKNQSPAPDQSQSSPSFFGIIASTMTGSVRGAIEAVQTPFEDVGIKRQPIPDQLKKMPADPYALPVPANCSTIAAAIADLNTALGPDMVVRKTDGDNSSLVSAWNNAKNVTWENKDHYMQQSSSMLQQKAADEVRSHVSIIPYRTWVRWISGADSHVKKVAEAYEA